MVKLMTKWEYDVIPLITAMQDMGFTQQKEILDKYGSEGWELISVTTIAVHNSIDIIAYFKREKYKREV